MISLIASLIIATSGNPETITGFASSYAADVFEGVIRLRHKNDWWRNNPPMDWYKVAGYIATNDCNQVGTKMELRAGDSTKWLPVFVGDCAGNDGTPQWMIDNNIIAELDYSLFTKLVEQHGAPLQIELR